MDAASPIAQFEAFELDVRSGELRRNGEKVPLQEQPFRLLRLLVERAGEVVTREELQQKLWPNDFVDFDHSLNAAMRKLRVALDDSADEPRCIETLARRGYRFIKPVKWIAAKNGSRRFPFIAIAALVLAVSFGIVALRRHKAAHTIDAIAILPFATDDPRNQPLADGLTEALIDNISRLKNVRVIARATAFRFKADANPQNVARDLKVGAMVTGRIRRETDRYTIRVELIDTRDSTQIWGEQFIVRSSEISSLQKRIADTLSSQLHREQQPAAAWTKSADAYDAYLKGLYEWNRRDVSHALTHFNRAAELDPAFAGAYSGMANVFGVMIAYGQLSPQEGTPKVLAAARRALEIDPQNAEALVSIAATKFGNLWDFAGAERDYRQALAINPNYATGHQWYADYLRAMGRFDEAHRENQLAVELDPLSLATNAAKCYGLYGERRYDEAIAFSRKAPLPSRESVFPRCEIAALIAKGDFDRAITLIETTPGMPPSLRSAIGDAYRKGGMAGATRVQLEALLGTSDAKQRHELEIAEAYASLGEKEEAFRYLEIAYANRLSGLTSITYRPLLDPLRSDRRFDDLLRRIGLPKLIAPAVHTRTGGAAHSTSSPRRAASVRNSSARRSFAARNPLVRRRRSPRSC